MIRKCAITGKKAMHGNKRSHAMNATKRLFLPNLHFHRFWYKEQKRFITIRTSAKGIRLIDKLGLKHYLLTNKNFLKNKFNKI